MVKKKGKSKRTTLKDKYKIRRRVLETKRKVKKQGKRDSKNGVVKPNQQQRDPGIPNSWPFKQDLLKEIQRSREKQNELQTKIKERRKGDLKALREHQEQGGTARTVQELMARATQDQQKFQAKQLPSDSATTMNTNNNTKSDGTVVGGQQSRRAYLRELKKVVDTADVLLQVLDARDPIGSRIHPTMEDVILSKADKRMVLVLNKIDLVPKEVVGSWLTHLRRSRPTVAIKAGNDHSSSSNNNNTTKESSDNNIANSTVPVGMDGLLQLLKNYARTGGTGGKSKTTIVVGIIGYPNVGKSSIINALKRCRAVGVSPRPGFTTSMQEVVLDRNVRLLDSPGVVFDDQSTLLGNCVDAESVGDPIPPVDALLKRCNPQSLMMTYNIPAFPKGDTMAFLGMVARSYGRVLKGGIPDKIGAARAVLKDWNCGKIPYYTVPPKYVGTDDVANKGSAIVVSDFGAEFDLSKFDEQVLNKLEGGRDEMDFVQVNHQEEGGSGTPEMCADNQRLVRLLKGKDDDDEMDDDDDDEEQEDDSDNSDSDSDDDMDEDDKDTTKVARGKLAQAEDFNFEDM